MKIKKWRGRDKKMPPLLFGGGGGDATAANQTNIEAKIDIIDANVDTLIERAQCDVGMIASTTTIDCADLAGYTEDYFNLGWKMCVLLNEGTPGAAPENEWRDITNYVSATGVFTTVAFSANVQENDFIMVARAEYANGGRGWEYQGDAPLNQAAPVQNTWYTLLDTTTVPTRIRALVANIEDADETLECQITIDGVTLSGSTVCTHSTTYSIYPLYNAVTRATTLFFSGASGGQLNPAYIFLGNSIKIELRKTTANGAGNLTGLCVYHLEERW